MKQILFHGSIILLLLCLFKGQRLCAQVPVIDTFYPATGSAGSAVVTIQGNNFSETASDNIVYFGSVAGKTLSATKTKLTARVPFGASFKPLNIMNSASKLSAASAGSFAPTFPYSNEFNSLALDSAIEFFNNKISIDNLVADFDGDGKIDIASINSDGSSFSITIHRNNVYAGYLSGASLRIFAVTLFTLPAAFASADFDRDGKPDLVTANGTDNSITVFRNNSTTGMILFEPGIRFATGTNPTCLAIGDIDEDGKPDVVSGNTIGASISILRNIETTPGRINPGSFASKFDFNHKNGRTHSIALGNFNADNKVEIAIAGDSMNSPSIFLNSCTPGVISDTNFKIMANFFSPLGYKKVIATNLDSDLYTDLIIIDPPPANMLHAYSCNPSDTLSSVPFFSRGNFALSAPTAPVTTGDMDGDGLYEIINANSTLGTIEIMYQKYGSGFTRATIKSAQVTGLNVADIDSDGKAELIVFNNKGAIGGLSVLKNNPADVYVTTPWNLSKYHPKFSLLKDAVSHSSTQEGDAIYLAAKTFNERNITITKSLSIYGSSNERGQSTTLDGENIPANASGGLFHIAPGGNLTLVDVHLQNGNAGNNFNGGAVYNRGRFTLSAVSNKLNIVAGNQAKNGGAIYNDDNAILTIDRNLNLTNNEAVNGDGGGIYNVNGTVNLGNDSNFFRNIYISDNKSLNGKGGAIFNLTGIVNITQADIVGNSANAGNAMYNLNGQVSTSYLHIYNPYKTGALRNEIVHEDGALNSQGCWWGKSLGVRGLISGKGMVSLKNYSVAGWRVNDGYIKGYTNQLTINTGIWRTTNGTDSSALPRETWKNRLTVRYYAGMDAVIDTAKNMYENTASGGCYFKDTIPTLRTCMGVLEEDTFTFIGIMPNYVKASDKDLILCGTDSAVFTALSDKKNQWYKNDTLIPGATGKTYTCKSTGRFKLINTEYYPFVSDVIERFVFPRPIIDSVQFPQTSICVGDTLNLDSSLSESFWSSENDTIAKVYNSKIYGGKAGTTKLVYTRRNAQCEQTKQQNLRVNISPGKPKINPDSVLAICSNQSITLNVNSSKNIWYRNEKETIDSNKRAITIQQSGNYTLKEIGDNGCVSQMSAPAKISVYPQPPKPEILVGIDSIKTGIAGAISAKESEHRLVWSTPQATGNSLSFFETNSGYKPIWLVNVSKDGCVSDTLKLTIKVSADQYWDIDVSVFPNPFSNELNVSGIDLKYVHSISLYNELGMRMVQSEIPARSLKLKLPENLLSGHYLLEVETVGMAKQAIKVFKN